MKEALNNLFSFTLSLFQGGPRVLPQFELDTTLAELYELNNPSKGEDRLGYLVCLTNSEIDQTSTIPRNTKYLYQETTFATTAIEATPEQRRQLRRNLAIKYQSVAPQHDAFAAGDMPVILFDPDVDGSDNSLCYLQEYAERTMSSLNREQRPKLLCFASPDQISLGECGIDRFAIKACLDGYDAFPLVVDLETNYFLNTKAALSTSRLPSYTPKSTPSTLIISDLVPDSVGDWGLTFFVTESGDCVFLAADRQVIGTDSRAWIGSDSLKDKFTSIMRQIGAWLSSHGYYGPYGADIRETAAAAAAPEHSATDEQPVYHIVDLNVRSTSSLVLGLMRGHFSRRRGLHYASAFTISVEDMTRDVFIRRFERPMREGRVVVVSWYEDRESGSSCGRVVVGAETEERFLREVVGVMEVGLEVRW
ncbi:MAG: hypothetical protein Q9194_002144 [Teloschistes cf. exilis]